jgi:hypothetical protein
MDILTAELQKIKREAAASKRTPRPAPTPATDIKGQIVAVLTDGDLGGSERNDAVARLVVESLTNRGAFYYHQQHRDFSTAMFFDAETKRLLRVQADAFVAWLSTLTGINRGAPVFKYVQAAVETAALSGDKTTGIIPEAYFAARPGAFYISNGDGQAVKITSGHVALVDNGTDAVLFGAGCTLSPWTLTEPVDPFTTCRLFAGANYADPHGKMLLKLWLLSLPTMPTCKPPLVIAGAIRSGKTRIVRGICELFGLPQCVEEPGDNEKSETGFWVGMDSGGLLCLDNVDSRVAWLADAIASASTGAGKFPRKLYTDNQRIELRPRAWLALTTCNATFAADAGLADRLIVVRMNQRTGETSDETLSTEITANRDAALSWIARTLADALADTVPTPSGLNRRHPDFAALAVRIGRALGCEAEAVAALTAAESDKSRFCLENDPAGAALLAMLADGKSFTGTAAELLDVLAEYDLDFGEDAKGARGNRLWTAKRLGKRLAILWQYIAELADAKQERDNAGHAAVFSIRPSAVMRFETLKQEKSSRKSDIGGFAVSAKETAIPQSDRSDLLPSQIEMASYLEAVK